MELLVYIILSWKLTVTVLVTTNVIDKFQAKIILFHFIPYGNSNMEVIHIIDATP